jgi:hypothetical protein
MKVDVHSIVERFTRREMAAGKFVVDDRVRLIGTDTILTVRQYNAETFEYQVQRSDDATPEWVLGIYLELVGGAAKKPAIRDRSATR